MPTMPRTARTEKVEERRKENERILSESKQLPPMHGMRKGVVYAKMKHAINPRQWNFEHEEITNIWIAEDLLTMSTRVYKPEAYKKTGILYQNMHEIHTLGSLEEMANDIRSKMKEPFDGKHHQYLTIAYCQIMQQITRREK